jgi:hypothetical protein
MFRIDGNENAGHAMGGPNYDTEPTARPYADHECRHYASRRFYNKGVLTCQDCGATYDESTLTWISH